MTFSNTISLEKSPSNIKISVLEKEINLPDKIKSKVNQYWETINRQNTFRRGEVFTVH
ncbi:hypothetical protein [Psychrobacillus sp. BL-248-WT-3]|uniref:hypothetical protein n=1 Tax=Psychrobacillus sp. BL-248-WT-3 TaxID=2725306 RepID=UPI00146F6690|nr:hypothetical protein [Psychrobacillus sp. BL-248-WT-3]NME06510.1 hypothetical protein [Psychrobacillus sp. BL-248-WT-3]